MSNNAPPPPSNPTSPSAASTSSFSLSLPFGLTVEASATTSSGNVPSRTSSPAPSMGGHAASASGGAADESHQQQHRPDLGPLMGSPTEAVLRAGAGSRLADLEDHRNGISDDEVPTVAAAAPLPTTDTETTTTSPPDLEAPTPETALVSTPQSESRTTVSHQQQQRITLEPPVIAEEIAKDVTCWICYGDYLDTLGDKWVKPCKCKGTLGYTHEACLLRFIASKDTAKPSCPQCGTPYRIISPASMVLIAMYRVDRVIAATTPYALLATGGLVALFASTTYGAYALLTLAGPETAEQWLGHDEWGWRVWTGLPLILPVITLSRTTALDHVLPLVPLWLIDARRVGAQITGAVAGHLPSSEPSSTGGAESRLWPPTPATTLVVLPWARFAWNTAYAAMSEAVLLPILMADDGAPTVHDGLDTERARLEQARTDLQLTERTDLGRLFMGATLAPALAAMTGALCARYIPGFREVLPSRILQSLAGGCAFVVAKDMAYLWYRHQKLMVSRRRRVVNYVD
ncbi:hypothetical protein BC828DRAFT_28730 [Blastocladiella britannica]|nr:hypothetical protein BC828DRAFT_28730 [Blastocladiella britannica]